MNGLRDDLPYAMALSGIIMIALTIVVFSVLKPQCPGIIVVIGGEAPERAKAMKDRIKERNWCVASHHAKIRHAVIKAQTRGWGLMSIN